MANESCGRNDTARSLLLQGLKRRISNTEADQIEQHLHLEGGKKRHENVAYLPSPLKSTIQAEQ